MKEVAGHELKARVDVRVERGQMARTGGPEAASQCSPGLAAVRGGVRQRSPWMTQHSAGRTPGRPSGNKKCCQDSHGKRSRGVATLATNIRSLGTMVQVNMWTTEALVEQQHTTKECVSLALAGQIHE